ncbi:bifunctional diaminohydroxyphosphoribosylaminopyrimidine deaminase/5-amino-6-(5-phosphoribosylamino)uracil reductase RibD [Paenarthrobacter sp. Z7-10]|uniref:bifunctional diaminohydroxyphosphoribosylaminopyrimidine deaminase/5-amino-6-(5-phosphoribosylamino)uracil reductase RibD n=1 Tax=Paenarthrobacter sp. Z7-10 TaxID=2787635 RepID=UPI0022A98758|nr:bifunctional diaminohydroxyphosphoribosylaminopyrimidine deaminase/5-amino-6-(5-phosphoribosylamino)uracil reductase RibD [Paenarthrobacter sp. Z7-10]MCZ2403403.1 bifunctional diaminohydroxyphosphoribosylaminopyrimidine deaminase/5-amino-6-(5-phosphoribosylamino)uracil reductase RibD [Paenarthrobacter sp. Z7-10]
MAAALTAALLGVRGANPLVGAVIIDAAGRPLGTGYHRGAGTAHAEAAAIANLPALPSGSLADATIVVTLEPCNHTGRTGPCSQAIIDAGIGRVIYALDDPHRPASGGADRLRGAGVEVRCGLLADRAAELNRRWFSSTAADRPFISLHIAQTLDGRIAAADGSSQWITSAPSLADSHRLRGRVDAILAGTGTVLLDDPRLTARTPEGELCKHQPLRVVMGLRDIPDSAAVRSPLPGNPDFLHLRTRDPHRVVAELFSRGVQHLMIEGGAQISSAFLAAGLVDELNVYLAPTLLGAGLPALADIGIGTLADAQHWCWDDAGGGAVVALGPDLKLHLAPAPAAATGNPGGI